MNVPPETIVAAAKALAASGLRKRLESVCSDGANEAYRILPEIFPHIEHILTLVDVAPQIAASFQLVVDAQTLRVTLPPGYDLDTDLVEKGIFDAVPRYGLRCRNILRNEKMTTVRALSEGSYRWLHSSPGFGLGTKNAMRKALAEAAFNPDEFPCLRVD